MPRSFESVQLNACVHRLDLGLYFHLKEFWGIESEPMLTLRGKPPLPEAQRRIKPMTLHHAGQWPRSLLSELFWPLTSTIY